MGIANAEEMDDLLPLTASFEAKHEIYVDHLSRAVKKDDICNIALSGGYGVGKSSILKGFAEGEQGKTIKISLSTLGTNLENGNKQADSSGKNPSPSVTNLIEKEIVKQILYCESSEKMPLSRFRRISKPRFYKKACTATLLGLTLSLVFIVAGWANSLLSFFHIPSTFVSHSIVTVVIFVIAFLLFMILEHLFRGHIGSMTLEKISAGSATISLSSGSPSYFDEYLDELMYFFEVSKRKIVIFEDIDRFDDPHIFEELRALNELLNNTSARLKKKKSCIRFVYAVKDGIFDDKGPIDDKIADSSRTKFFDLIIPVVPFITQRNSRDLMTSTFDQDEFLDNISHELISLLSGYITDMRLVKNIRNEFSIFCKKVLDGNGRELGINEDKVLAMVAYKNVFPADFEEIKCGKSRLDVLYRNGRALIKDGIDELNQKRTEVLRQHDLSTSSRRRSRSLGDKLGVFLDGLLESASKGSFGQNAQMILEYDNREVDYAFLQEPEFWNSLVSSGKMLSIKLSNGGFNPSILLYSKDDIAKALGENLSEDNWRKQDSLNMQEQIQQTERAIECLAEASMADLMDHGELLRPLEDGVPHSFSYQAVEECGEMTSKLIKAGFIDWDFAFCISVYYGRCISARGENFIVRNIGQNIMDIYLPLTKRDVADILQECGDSILLERGAYNISILDFLLESDDTRSENLVKALGEMGPNEREFLRCFLPQSDKATAFIAKFAKRSNLVLTFVSSELDADEPTSIRLLDIALTHLSSGLVYDTDTSYERLIQDNYSSMQAFTSEEMTEEQSGKVADTVLKGGVHLESLKALSSTMREAIVLRSAFKVNSENLELAVGNEDISINVIKDRSEVVYDYVLHNLSLYFEAIRESGKEFCISDSDKFTEIVNDVTEHDETSLASFLSFSSANCIVRDISEVPESTWKILAKHGRFAVTIENVINYIGYTGGIDEALAAMLRNSTAIEDTGVYEEPAKVDLAKALLRAKELIPEPLGRIKLVNSLQLQSYLPVDILEAEGGRFVGLLIEQSIIEDAASAFTLIPEGDWEAREFAIGKSGNFELFMTPTEVSPSDVLCLMDSKGIRATVKQVVANNLETYTKGFEVDGLTRVADLTASNNLVLPPVELEYLIGSGVAQQMIVKALCPGLPTIEASDLQNILKELGGEYALISERTTKWRQWIVWTSENEAIVKRLKEFEIVSKSEKVDRYIRISMKKPIQ